MSSAAPPEVGQQSRQAQGEGKRGAQISSVASLLPALVAIGGLVAVVTGALGLVGATDVDLPALTRGAPVRTLIGASLLLLAIITAGIGAVPGASKPFRWTRAGYGLAAAGLILYVWAAIHVTKDPAAPQIHIERDAETEETRVKATVSGLAFDERLHLMASYQGEEGLPFARRVLGAGGDGKVDHQFVVEPPSESRRLRVTAAILQKNQIVRDFDCNVPDAGRTCAEAAAEIPRGMPEVRTTLSRGVLHVAILDRRRIPGLLAMRITRRGHELHAVRARVERSVFRVALRLRPRLAGAGGRDAVCVAATYGADLPRCKRDAQAESFVRLYPSRAQLRSGARTVRR